jgi:Rrf2 family protein
LDIPLPFLYQISHTLIRSGLIKAFSGPRGGLQLNRPSNQINILDIVQAIDGSLTINPCSESKKRSETACVTASMWQNLETNISLFFESTFLNTLVR